MKKTRAGDSRPPGQPPDLHEEGMLTLPSGIASISRDSPETEGHVKTIRTGDGRPPGQPPDLHEEGMLTLPSGIAPISRDSPEGQVKKTRAGDGRPPGQPPDIHEEGMLTLPSGIAPISRASPEGDKTPDNCHRWTSQPLGFIKLMGDGRTPGEPPDHYYKVTSQFLDYTRVMGDGRPPGEPPDHEGTSHTMDYIRVMGDGRTPGEPPDHCHKGTSQPLDHNTIWGLYLPFYRASSAFLWTVPVLMSRRHRLVDFYCVYSAFLWTVLVLMARRHRLVDFYCVSSAFLWIVPVVLARRHRLVDFYRALPRRPSTEYQADASLTLLKGTTGNDSTQRISEYWNENYQHVIVRPTGHLSNGLIVPVTIGGIDIQVHVLIVIPIVRDGHPRGQSPEECRLNNCSSGYQTDILHSSSESIQAINECSNSPSTLEQVTGDLNNGCFIPVITESDVAALTDYGSQKHHMLFGSDTSAKVVTDVPLFIIEDQTYPVAVIIPAPDELLLKGGFLSRHNCIPWWGIGVESETELPSFMPDCSYPSDVIKSPYIPECQNNSAGPHDMLLKGGFMSRHNCIPDCSNPPDLAHSSRPSVIFKEEWFLPRFNCIPEWCDTLLRNMTSDLHKLRLIIQMVTAVFCEMLEMDNAQPVETTPMFQCVSYPLMEDICQIKCIKPPQEHLIDISQEDQWMRHTPTGFNLVKDEQLDNTQYLYITTLCLSISYIQVKNDGKHCDQEMSNSHHLISDHLKIDFALSNIPDVSHQNLTYSCWWSKVDQNRITKLVTRRYVSDHIRMDYGPCNKPEIFQESISLHDVVHIESYVYVCGCLINTKELFHLLQPIKCTTLHLRVVLLIAQSIASRTELITEWPHIVCRSKTGVPCGCSYHPTDLSPYLFEMYVIVLENELFKWKISPQQLSQAIIQVSTNGLMRFLNRECTFISTTEAWIWMKTDVFTRIHSSTGVNISRLKNCSLRYIDYVIYLCSELGEQSSVGHRTGVPFTQCH